MFGQGWGRLSKRSKTDKWAQFHYFVMYQSYGNILYTRMYLYLNEQTICPVLTGIHTVYTQKYI